MYFKFFLDHTPTSFMMYMHLCGDRSSITTPQTTKVVFNLQWATPILPRNVQNQRENGASQLFPEFDEESNEKYESTP